MEEAEGGVRQQGVQTSGSNHKLVAILITAVIIIIVEAITIGICSYCYESYSTASKAFILSWFLIGTFILALICMDYMTGRAYEGKTMEWRINKLEERSKSLRKQIDNLKGQVLEQTDLQKKKSLEDEISKNEKLRAENEESRQSLLSELSEPVGVLDKHEIRRALTISITITYFLLLSLSIFGIGELDPNSGMINLFSKVFLVMIAFYFGSRAVEEGIKLHAATKKGKGKEES